MREEVLAAFGLDAKNFFIEPVGSGYINLTYKVTGHSVYILQRINKNIFKHPEVIANNLRTAADHLKKFHPDYLFLSPLKTADEKEMVYDEEGFPWRLFPYIKNSTTIDSVSTAEEAFSAASEFARLARYLEGVDVNAFGATLERFHDLTWRYEQFETALANASADRKEEAYQAIKDCLHFKYLVNEYNELVSKKNMKLRIMHNDTKINNILFDATTRKAVCVIDIDTLMPGYFIYDVGDMIRTFVSPVSEEEKDLDKIIFRKEIYDALVQGYNAQMEDKLEVSERGLFHFAGMMMTYIMALRILADFLNGDIYYRITYRDQNLVRARNQLQLLQVLDNNKY
jgi:Ser/Thr protein kinase RdoA (MazF antagonist)